jgi:hypothetical protein
MMPLASIVGSCRTALLEKEGILFQHAGGRIVQSEVGPSARVIGAPSPGDGVAGPFSGTGDGVGGPFRFTGDGVVGPFGVVPMTGR